MRSDDFEKFAKALTAVSELYGKPLSAGAQALWWQALERFEFEQVSKAIRAHTQDAGAGQFMPKPADLIRSLEGTFSDRSAIAWGKALDAASRVGAYQDVIFDDPAIHAAIEDMGGWSKFCRCETKDLSYTQHRFCELHKAYSGRGAFDYPRFLSGDRSADDIYTKRGLPPPKPVVIGDVVQARFVYRSGVSGGKTSISFNQTIEKETKKLNDKNINYLNAA